MTEKEKIELSDKAFDLIQSMYDDYDGQGYIIFDPIAKIIKCTLNSNPNLNKTDVIKPISYFVYMDGFNENIDYKKVDSFIISALDKK